MQATDHHVLTPRGPFDLRRSIEFLEGWPATATLPRSTSELRFAYCAEHDWMPVGVRVTAEGDDLAVTTSRPVGDEVLGEIARILSVDVDATPLAEIGERDPVVARLLRSESGKRPVCFWSPWEAACWAVLSQRTSMRTASILKHRIATTHGTAIDLDGEEHWAFPSPQAVLDTASLRGVPPVKLERIHELAGAALDGTLTAAHLRGLDHDAALAQLRALPGIGPFSASLILIRGAGAPDAFTAAEPRLLAAIAAAYDLPEKTPVAEYQNLAENWRPLRSWIAFLLRSAAPHPTAKEQT